jgi:type VI secretion system protein ImpC
MANAQAQGQVPVAQLAELDSQSLLDQIVDTGIRPRDDSGRVRAADLVRTLVEQLLTPGMVVAKGVTETINARVAAIDEVLSRQLDQIMHHPDFQKLEASWRGLHKLVMASETGESLKIRVLNVSKKDLLRDFGAAAEFTESALWKAIYEHEFGTYGGDPFGTLIGDYEFDKGPQDIEVLQQLASVAAASHAPFISAASPRMFAMESFTEMPNPRDVAKIFDKNNPENTKWLSLRDSEDSRFLALVLPHTLRRLPYGRTTKEVDAFDYEEDVSGHHNNYLWGSAAFEYGQTLTAAFAKHHWCVAIRGPEGGGLIEDLPIHVFKSKEGDITSKIPTETLISDTREKEVSDLGFIGLLNCKNTDYAAFFGGNSIQRPKKYDRAEATANAKLSSQIPYLMATSRIAHYLKSICRDKIGSFMSRSDCENFLNRWITQYVTIDDNASQETKAQYPLREARVDVIDDKARPGCYKAVAYLRPHFQLEELNISLRLVADLPPPAQK